MLRYVSGHPSCTLGYVTRLEREQPKAGNNRKGIAHSGKGWSEPRTAGLVPRGASPTIEAIVVILDNICSWAISGARERQKEMRPGSASTQIRQPRLGEGDNQLEALASRVLMKNRLQAIVTLIARTKVFARLQKFSGTFNCLSVSARSEPLCRENIPVSTGGPLVGESLGLPARR